MLLVVVGCWLKEGKAVVCRLCFCWLWSWLIVGLLWFWRACWARKGLLRWPDELLADMAWVVERSGWVEPKGLVLLGRAGIRFSWLTRDALSPRKLSGVFRWLAACANELCCCCLGGWVAKTFFWLCSAAFHGLVEVLEVLWSLFSLPKKSPNGSASSLAVNGNTLIDER